MNGKDPYVRFGILKSFPGVLSYVCRAGYIGGRGACKANASTRRFFALFTTEALRVTGVEQ